MWPPTRCWRISGKRVPNELCPTYRVLAGASPGEHPVAFGDGQSEHPLFRERRSTRGAPNRLYGRVGYQRHVRHPEVDGHPPGVSVGPKPSHRLSLHAEALLVDEPNRNMVLHTVSQSYPTRKLYVHRRPDIQAVGLHRLLRRHHDKALAMY